MAEYENILPPPLKVDQSFRELAKLANDWPELNADIVRTLAHIQTADPVRLQHYAEWFSLSDEPAWSYALDDGARRLLAAGAVMLHRLKGTPWAVKKVLELIGMGAGTRLIEGGVQRRYDGLYSHDGSILYSGGAWAEYSIEADLGETAGLDAGTGSLIRKVLAGIAPARCHLTDVRYRVETNDEVPSADAAQVMVEGVLSDMPERMRYDGTYRHDAGLENAHDGAVRADGSTAYCGWRLKPNWHHYGAEDSVVDAAAVMALDDRVSRPQTHNGTRRSDGSLDYGASAPGVGDEPMSIRKTVFVRYNGMRTYSGSHAAAGDIITNLEAA